MKILLVTDIHEDYDAAKSAYHIEKPDFVLDCGDHKEIINLFELTPHFYIFGNHEPTVIATQPDEMPLPTKINQGTIYELKKCNDIVRFAGLDGNYAHDESPLHVSEKSIDALRNLTQKSLEILLVHESPLDVGPEEYISKLASEVVKEIDRIKPKIVFSGHRGVYNKQLTKDKVPVFTLDDMHRGYGVLSVENGKYYFKRKRAFFQGQISKENNV